jgi:hypothetical protein
VRRTKIRARIVGDPLAAEYFVSGFTIERSPGLIHIAWRSGGATLRIALAPDEVQQLAAAVALIGDPLLH